MQRGEFNMIRTTIISLFILCLVFSKGLFAAEERSVKLPEAKLPSANAKPSVVDASVVPDRNTAVKTAVSPEDMRLGEMYTDYTETTGNPKYKELVPPGVMRKLAATKNDPTIDDAYNAIRDCLREGLINNKYNNKTYKNIRDLLKDDGISLNNKEHFDKLPEDIKKAINAAFPPVYVKTDQKDANGNQIIQEVPNPAVESMYQRYLVKATGKEVTAMGYDALVCILSLKNEDTRNSLLEPTLAKEIKRRSEEIASSTYEKSRSSGMPPLEALLCTYKGTFADTSRLTRILTEMSKLTAQGQLTSVDTNYESPGYLNAKVSALGAARDATLKKCEQDYKAEKTAAEAATKQGAVSLPHSTSLPPIAAERGAQIDQVAESLIRLSSKKGEFTPEETKMVFNAFNYRSKEVANMLFDELSPDVLDRIQEKLPEELKSQFSSRRMDRSFNAKRVMDELTAAANNKSYIKTPDKLLEIISMSLTTSNFNSDFIQKNLKMLDHECIKAEGINLATFLQETLMKVRRDSSKYPVIQNVVKVLNDL